MEGLGATLTSLIRNCSDSKETKLWFLCSGLHERDKGNIRQLLQNENFEGIVEFVDFDAKKMFGHLRSLHGDWTNYGRLLIPAIVKSEFALYLDKDLIIESDILELKDFRTSKIMSAVCGSSVQYALENRFFTEKRKWHPDTGYLNSGVLMFNITLRNKENVSIKVKEIANRYSKEILSHDQTLLNAVCEGSFGYLPKEFNLPWYPGDPQPASTTRAIIHFIGSPKPWDLFGKIIHEGYNTRNAYNSPFWKSKYGKMSIDKLIRTWMIQRSIVKNLKIKLTAR